MAAGDRDSPEVSYEALAAVTWAGSDEPLWVRVGSAVAIVRAPSGEPTRIRVKVDVLPHQGTVLIFGPKEGLFELALMDDGVGSATSGVPSQTERRGPKG